VTARHLTKGRWAELLAQAHFLQRGWTVFGAVHHFGMADLVVLKNAGVRLEMHAVEVKYHDLNSGKQRHRTAKSDRVQLCHVSSDGTVSCELTAYKPRDQKDSPDGC